MGVERTIPILPCRSLDDVVPFYAALGFAVTFRQDRPYAYLCVNRGGLDLHFFVVEDLDPAQSLGNVIVQVPDTGVLFDAFAAGLRAARGRLPVTGIPRITRPRRKQGTAGGFTVVDPGGNSLRVSSASSEPDDTSSGPLERVMLNAARQGDARGDPEAAIRVLDAGLARHPDATPAQRVAALVYRAELLIRVADWDRAGTALADVRSLSLSGTERERLANELAAAAELQELIPGAGEA